MPTLGTIKGFAPNLLRVVQPDPASSLYVGIYADSSDMFAWGYGSDGSYVEQLATLANPTGNSPVAGALALLSVSPLVVVIGTASAGFLDGFTVWNATAGTAATVDRSASESVRSSTASRMRKVSASARRRTSENLRSPSSTSGTAAWNSKAYGNVAPLAAPSRSGE